MRGGARSGVGRVLQRAVGRAIRGERPEQRVRRGGVKGELALALPPTLTVLGVLVLVQALAGRRVLFASLASSAFLIYRDPEHRMNSIRVMVTAQLVGAAVGVACALLLTPGYTAGGVAMVATIVLLILLDTVHPPAIATALGFAFSAGQGGVVGIFLVALGIVAALVLLQRLALWTVRRLDAGAGKGGP